MTTRWYMINSIGMATLCTDEADARSNAADADEQYPRHRPHRAVQMVEVDQAPAATSGIAIRKRDSLIAEGYRITGWLLSKPGDRHALMHDAAVRWLTQDSLWKLMHVEGSQVVEPAAPAPVAQGDMREAFEAWARGADPTADRHASRQAPTVAELADRYMREHAIPYKKPSSVALDRRTWDKHILPALGRHRVDAVTRADCVALHGGLARSPSRANQTRALLSKAFNLAVEWDWCTANPVAGTKRYRIRQRETVLTVQQLAAMDAALDGMTPAFAALVRLLTLTGCRLSEILTARRAWVDIERRLLLLPDSKTGPRRIALPHRAVAIIQAMPAHEWLIPGRKPGTHMAKPYTSWYALLRRAGLPRGTRIHDLRHSFGSHGHAQGLSQRQIATMLGHADLATTARYLHGLGQEAEDVDVVAERLAAGWRDGTLTQ